MPIDFPPPPVPVQGDATALAREAARSAVAVSLSGYVLSVHAPGVLDAEAIRLATAGVRDLSTAVRALAAAAQREGTLAPITLYARRGRTVYVSITPGRLAEIKAPKPLRPYFAGLPGKAPATVSAFEKKRLFASLHATRMGESYTPVFTPKGKNAYSMALRPSASPAPEQGAVRLNLSNAGNRFTGREFIDLDARIGTSAGDEFLAVARAAAAVFQPDEQQDGSEYYEYQLGWSRVTPLGLTGANVRYLDYLQHAGGTSFKGELWIGEVNHTGVLMASTTRRVTAQLRADYTLKRLTQESDGLLRQEEPYASLEAGTAYSQTLRLFSEGFLSLAALSVRKGFGDGDPRLTRADLGYWLARPAYSLRWQRAPWNGEFQLSGQYADVTVPEQQQWVLGGIGSLHAWVPGVAVGDRGVIARLAGERTLYEGEQVQVKLRALAEYGAAQYAEGFPDRPAGGTQALADAGVELIAGFKPYFEMALTTAVPIYDGGVAQAVLDEARTDFFFRLTARF